jgi:hypothetical protein
MQELPSLLTSACEQVDILLHQKNYEAVYLLYDSILGIAIENSSRLALDNYKTILSPCLQIITYLSLHHVDKCRFMLAQALCLAIRADFKDLHSSLRVILGKIINIYDNRANDWPCLTSPKAESKQFKHDDYIQSLHQFNYAYRLAGNSTIHQQQARDILNLHELDYTYQVFIQTLPINGVIELAMAYESWKRISILGKRLYLANQQQKIHHLYATFLQHYYQPLLNCGNQCRKKSVESFNDFINIVIKIGEEFVLYGLHIDALILYRQVLRDFLLLTVQNEQLMNHSIPPDRETKLYYAAKFDITILMHSLIVAAKSPALPESKHPQFEQGNWLRYRECVKTQRDILRSTHSIRAVQNKCTLNYQSLIITMLEDNIDVIGGIVTNTAIVGMGSYYYGMLPYSDLEFFVLTGDGCPKTIQTAQRLVQALFFKVNCLDESDVTYKLGFHLDESNKPYKDDRLLGAPEVLIRKLFDSQFEQIESTLKLEFSLCHVSLISGNESLLKRYCDLVKSRLNETEKNTGLKRYQWLAKQLLDINIHDFKCRKLDSDTRNVKSDYIAYLIPISLILGFYHQLSGVWLDKPAHYEDILLTLAGKCLQPDFAKYMTKTIEQLQALYLKIQWHYNEAKRAVALPHSQKVDPLVTYQLSNQDYQLLQAADTHLLNPLYCCLDKMLSDKLIDPAWEYVQKALDQNNDDLLKQAFIVYIDHLVFRQSNYVPFRNFYRNLNERHRQIFLTCAEKQLSIAVEQYSITVDQQNCILYSMRIFPNDDGSRPIHILQQQEFYSSLVELAIPRIPADYKGLAVTIIGPTIGQQFIHPNIIKYLQEKDWISKDGTFIDKEAAKTDLPGNHLTIPLAIEINHKPLNFHLKVFPEFPGMEMFVVKLYRLIVGWGAPLVELWRWQSGEHVYPVLISQTSIGQILQKALEVNPKILNLLDPKHFTQRAIMTMIINPEDDKFDNNILEEFMTLSGLTSCRLQTVDNDRAFEEPFKDNRVRVKSFIYCADQMQQILEQEAREEFLALDPLKLLQNLIRQVERDNDYYLQIFNKDIATLYGERRLFGGSNVNQRSLVLLPLKRFMFSEIFAKQQKLQDIIAGNLQITHQGLLHHLHPKLCTHYSNFASIQDPISRFDATTQGEYKKNVRPGERFTSTLDRDAYLKSMLGQLPVKDRLKELWLEDIMQARKELQLLSEHDDQIIKARNQLIAGNGIPFKSLPNVKAQEHVLNEIYFENDHAPATAASPWLLPKHFEYKFIQLLQGIPWRELKLNYLDKLDNNALLAILRFAPELRVLRVKGCNNLQGNVLNTVAILCPYLEIIDFSETQITHCQDRKLFEKTPLIIRYLKEFYLNDCMSLQIVDIQADRVQILQVKDCSKLTVLQTQSKNMQRMILTGCNALSYSALSLIVNNTITIDEIIWKNAIHPIQELVEACPVYLSIDWLVTTQRRMNELTQAARKQKDNYRYTKHTNRIILLNEMNYFLQDNYIVSMTLLKMIQPQSKENKQLNKAAVEFKKQIIEAIGNLSIITPDIINSMLNELTPNGNFDKEAVVTLASLDVHSSYIINGLLTYMTKIEILLNIIPPVNDFEHILTKFSDRKPRNLKDEIQLINKWQYKGPSAVTLLISALSDSHNDVKLEALISILSLKMDDPQLIDSVLLLLSQKTADNSCYALAIRVLRKSNSLNVDAGIAIINHLDKNGVGHDALPYLMMFKEYPQIIQALTEVAHSKVNDENEWRKKLNVTFLLNYFDIYTFMEPEDLSTFTYIYAERFAEEILTVFRKQQYQATEELIAMLSVMLDKPHKDFSEIYKTLICKVLIAIRMCAIIGIISPKEIILLLLKNIAELSTYPELHSEITNLLQKLILHGHNEIVLCHALEHRDEQVRIAAVNFAIIYGLDNVISLAEKRNTIINLLFHHDEYRGKDIRLAAISLLKRRIFSFDVLEVELIKHLKINDSQLQKISFEIINNLKISSERIINVLMDMLCDRNINENIKAQIIDILLLLKIANRKVYDTLWNLTLDGWPYHIKHKAAAALGKLNPPDNMINYIVDLSKNEHINNDAFHTVLISLQESEEIRAHLLFLWKELKKYSDPLCLYLMDRYYTDAAIIAYTVTRINVGDKRFIKLLPRIVDLHSPNNREANYKLISALIVYIEKGFNESWLFFLRNKCYFKALYKLGVYMEDYENIIEYLVRYAIDPSDKNPDSVRNRCKDILKKLIPDKCFEYVIANSFNVTNDEVLNISITNVALEICGRNPVIKQILNTIINDTSDKLWEKTRHKFANRLTHEIISGEDYENIIRNDLLAKLQDEDRRYQRSSDILTIYKSVERYMFLLVEIFKQRWNHIVKNVEELASNTRFHSYVPGKISVISYTNAISFFKPNIYNELASSTTGFNKDVSHEYKNTRK